jgi:hypothetical protein
VTRPQSKRFSCQQNAMAADELITENSLLALLGFAKEKKSMKK